MELAKLAYDIFNLELYKGGYYPAWEVLPKNVKQAWEKAIQTVETKINK